MRVLYHHRTVSKDGQDVHISELVRALRSRGHEVLVVAPPGAAEAGFGSDGGLVALLKRGLPRPLYEVLELGYSVPAYRRLARAWAAFQPDLLYERHNLFTLPGVWLKAVTGIPSLVEVNAPLAAERASHGGLALARLARWSEATVWRAADHVLPVTDVLADHVRAAGIPEERLCVIPNGVNPARFASADGGALRRQLGLEGRLVLGFTGFLRAWHGLGGVVEALAALLPTHPGLHLLVAGDGPARAELEQRAQALGVAGRVTVLGLVARERVAGTLAAFDIALQPQAVPYASPLKLFEYMAAGLAIIAPDQPNLREVLRHGDDSLLFPPGQPGALAAAIATLAGDTNLRRRLGQAAARAIIARGYTWDANAERIERLAAAAISRHRGDMPRVGWPLAGRAGGQRPGS